MPKTTKIGVIVVDLQGDFTEFKHGPLAVKGTDEAYIKAVGENTKRLKAAGFPIFATQDWHPESSLTLVTNHKGKKPFDVIKLNGKDQVLWPPHCFHNSLGAEVLLDKKLIKAFVKKGTNPQYESYSGFQDDGGNKTDMERLLKEHKINTVVVYGIATDYCVRATALDAIASGYRVILIRNLCRGIDLDASQKAIEEMKARGGVVLDDLDLERTKLESSSPTL